MVESQKPPLSYREMTLADLDAVIQVETRAYAFPWSRGIFCDCLNANYECRVICIDNEVVGHGVLSAAAGEAHLLNVCIKRDLQGAGLGRKFVHHLVHRAHVLGAATLFLEVRPTNKVAIALYNSIGFLHVGTRRDYYPGELGREDAIVMALELAA